MAVSDPPGLDCQVRDSVRRPSTYINALALAADVAETLTAPTFSSFPSAAVVAIFSPTTAEWYYSASGTAVVPSADVTDGSASGRAPVALKMTQGGTLSVVADAACILTIEWYIVREP